MSVASRMGRALAPRISELAPGLTSTFVREALHRAIVGVGPLSGAAVAAEKQLREQKGHLDRGVHEVIEFNVRLAGAQGFVTNLGGLVTATVAIPANVTGLAIIQCRMIAGIAHLRGYDIHDPRVRNAILVTLLGEDAAEELVKEKKIPGSPRELARAAAPDAALEQAVAGTVATELITRVTGKRLATLVAKRVPVVGGLVGMSADGFATWKVGRYADREFVPLARR